MLQQQMKKSIHNSHIWCIPLKQLQDQICATNEAPQHATAKISDYFNHRVVTLVADKLDQWLQELCFGIEG